VSCVHAVSDRQLERANRRAEGKSPETRVQPRSTGA
jgi:hypothetical protein